jgi:organic radical activating enzyme
VNVSEVFGPTLQGEGPSAGQPAAFLRLGGCNLACSWCDTPYTWDASRFDLREEITSTDDNTIAAQLLAMSVDRLVITGGEPLLQQRRLVQFLPEIAYAFPHVEIETNGTQAPDTDLLPLVEQFNVSPKLAHAGNGDKAIVPAVLRAFERTGKAVFKFVVATPADLCEVDQIVAESGLTDVWLMPEGTKPEVLADRLGWVCDAALKRGWSASSRLHILAWNDERGR